MSDFPVNVSGGMIGAGVEEIRWTHPVRPDDRLSTLAEILETRHLASGRISALSARSPWIRTCVESIGSAIYASSWISADTCFAAFAHGYRFGSWQNSIEEIHHSQAVDRKIDVADCRLILP